MTVTLSVSDGVATLRLNRPGKLNALDRETVRAFAAHAADLRQRDDVRVVVTRGEGRAFCAGSDLHDISSLSAAEAAAVELEHGAAFALLDALPQPTIAVIHGYALGGGLAAAIYHDFRVAAASALLGMPEVELGWIPPWGMGRMVDVVGTTHARWLTMTCLRIGADEAKALGLVNAVVPDTDLDAYVDALAQRLAAMPLAGLRTTKALINRMSPLRAAQWDAEASALFEACYGMPEAQANVAAFLARRKG